MHPAVRSSHASHGRQRKEMEVQDSGFAVGSLKTPLWRTPANVEIRLMLLSVCIIGVRQPGRSRICSTKFFVKGWKHAKMSGDVMLPTCTKHAQIVSLLQ